MGGERGRGGASQKIDVFSTFWGLGPVPSSRASIFRSIWVDRRFCGWPGVRLNMIFGFSNISKSQTGPWDYSHVLVDQFSDLFNGILASGGGLGVDLRGSLFFLQTICSRMVPASESLSPKGAGVERHPSPLQWRLSGSYTRETRGGGGNA